MNIEDYLNVVTYCHNLPLGGQNIFWDLIDFEDFCCVWSILVKSSRR